MLDLLILIGFGALFGAAASSAKLKAGLVALATAILGAIFGIFLVQLLPQSLQLVQIVLTLQPGASFQLIYSSSGLSGLVQFAQFFWLYGALVGFAFSLLGYGLGALIFRVTRKR